MKYVRILAVSFVASSFIACGNATHTLSNVSDSGLSTGGAQSQPSPVPDMSDLNAKLSGLDTQITSVDSGLNDLSLQDPLNLLSGSVKDSVKKLSGLVDQVHAKTAELKTKINAQIALLDASNPQEQQIIAKLQEAVSYLDQVDVKLDELVAKVESKIDALFAKLETKLEQKLSGIKLILAKVALSQVKDAIVNNLIGH